MHTLILRISVFLSWSQEKRLYDYVFIKQYKSTTNFSLHFDVQGLLQKIDLNHSVLWHINPLPSKTPPLCC